jgi:hypothetical protein
MQRGAGQQASSDNYGQIVHNDMGNYTVACYVTMV